MHAVFIFNHILDIRHKPIVSMHQLLTVNTLEILSYNNIKNDEIKMKIRAHRSIYSEYIAIIGNKRSILNKKYVI